MHHLALTVLVASAAWVVLTAAAAGVFALILLHRKRDRSLSADVYYHTAHGHCFHSTSECEALRRHRIFKKRPCKLCIKVKLE